MIDVHWHQIGIDSSNVILTLPLLSKFLYFSHMEMCLSDVFTIHRQR